MTNFARLQAGHFHKKTMKISEATREALETILAYLDEEERDYFTTPADDCGGHIYESVLRVRRWLNSPTGEPSHFGGCPKCGDGQNDGFLNIGRGHWFVCHIHRLKWWGGSNLFRNWRHEDEFIWRENYDLLKDYEEAEPFNPKD